MVRMIVVSGVKLNSISPFRVAKKHPIPAIINPQQLNRGGDDRGSRI